MMRNKTGLPANPADLAEQNYLSSLSETLDLRRSCIVPGSNSGDEPGPWVLRPGKVVSSRTESTEQKWVPLSPTPVQQEQCIRGAAQLTRRSEPLGSARGGSLSS